MPIRPEDRGRYPKDWKALRAAALERAGHRCEGSPRYPDCRAADRQPHPETGSMVVLTLAHLDHTPETADLEKLRMWCQRCHLTYDAKWHARNARATRAKRAGQLAFAAVLALGCAQRGAPPPDGGGEQGRQGSDAGVEAEASAGPEVAPDASVEHEEAAPEAGADLGLDAGVDPAGEPESAACAALGILGCPVSCTCAGACAGGACPMECRDTGGFCGRCC